MDIIAGSLILATFVEGLVNYLVGKGDEPRAWVKYLALLCGVAVAVLFQVDIFSLAGLVGVHPYVGYVATGLVVGRGSNYLNDFVTLFKK
jgi:hypothetical protein